MKRIYLQLIVWVILTGSYFLFKNNLHIRLDQVQAVYFIVSVFPSVILYRLTSLKYLSHLESKGEIDSSIFQIRILGTIAPLFLLKLFVSGDGVRNEVARQLKIQFVVAIAILLSSILIIRI